MTLVKYNPIAVRNPMNQFWGNMERMLRHYDTPETDIENGWTPAFQIRENKDSYKIQADLPGIEKTDLNIHVMDGILSISGERKNESNSEDVDSLRNEISSSKFERRFTLPEDVSDEGIQAELKNGVLNLEITRKQPVEPEKIQIKVA